MKIVLAAFISILLFACSDKPPLERPVPPEITGMIDLAVTTNGRCGAALDAYTVHMSGLIQLTFFNAYAIADLLDRCRHHNAKTIREELDRAMEMERKK